MLSHLLLIDDDEDEHLFFQWSLESLNIDVTLHNAYNADQAERILHRVVPDIIFLDINMSVKNGFQCLQEFRSMPALMNTPIYMYSTEINDTTIKKAMKMGASGCLKKSRNNEHLCRNLREILLTEPLQPNRMD